MARPEVFIGRDEARRAHEMSARRQAWFDRADRSRVRASAGAAPVAPMAGASSAVLSNDGAPSADDALYDRLFGAHDRWRATTNTL